VGDLVITSSVLVAVLQVISGWTVALALPVWDKKLWRKLAQVFLQTGCPSCLPSSNAKALTPSSECQPPAMFFVGPQPDFRPA